MSSTTTTTSPEKSRRFDPNTVYTVFRGPHVSVVCRTVDDDVYQIKMCRNCVYDVVGTRKMGVFVDKTWSEHLNTVDIKPKVIIKDYRGSELNELDENVGLGVSWMSPDGLAAYGTYTLSKNRKKTIM